MGYIRIPVSLKVEDDGDFYDFVLSLRDSKELSTFIVDLLKAYFDNKEIKEKVDTLLKIYNPFTDLKERLLKIQLEHSKAVMATSLLDNKIKCVVSKIEDNGVIEDEDVFGDIKKVYLMLDGEVVEKPNEVNEVVGGAEMKLVSHVEVDANYQQLNQRVTKIEGMLEDILGVLNELKYSKNGVENNLDNEEVEVVKENNAVKEVEKVSIEDNVKTSDLKIDVIVEEKNKINENHDNKVVYDQDNEVINESKLDNPFIIVSSEEQNKQEDRDKKVPTTFNKLLKSIKK